MLMVCIFCVLALIAACFFFYRWLTNDVIKDLERSVEERDSKIKSQELEIVELENSLRLAARDNENYKNRYNALVLEIQKREAFNSLPPAPDKGVEPEFEDF